MTRKIALILAVILCAWSTPAFSVEMPDAVLADSLAEIQKLRQEGGAVSREYGSSLVTLGCAELDRGNQEEAKACFEEAYALFMLLVGDNNVDGGSAPIDNLKSTVTGFTAIARHYLDKMQYEEALLWMDRLDSVMENYKHQVAEEQGALDRQGFIAALIVVAVLLAGLFVIYQFRRLSSRKMEETNRRLEIANAQAEEASRVKTAFLHQISHEIGTPLNLLAGFAQLLTTPGMELDENSREQVKKGIMDNTGRITGLVSKVLDLSDLISTPILEKKDSVQLGELADTAAKSCGITDNEAIHFVIQIHPKAKSQTIQTNQKAVTRILGLLLENAVKFTGEGSVTLRIVPKDTFVYFMVEDTGIGVPAQEAERIFENFVQLDEYREGTGIGLSLARRLARRLDGDVILDPSYTFGARFILSLPVADTK